MTPCNSNNLSRRPYSLSARPPPPTFTIAKKTPRNPQEEPFISNLGIGGCYAEPGPALGQEVQCDQTFGSLVPPLYSVPVLVLQRTPCTKPAPYMYWYVLLFTRLVAL